MKTWIVEKRLFDYEKQLVQTIEANGDKAAVIDFDRSNDLQETVQSLIAEGLIGTKESTIIHGSTRLYKFLSYYMTSSEAYLEYATYSRYIQDKMLNKDFFMMPWWALENMSSHKIINKFDKTFIRPNSPWKTFSGRVVSMTTYQKWYDMESKTRNLHPLTQCIVAEAKPIDKEWRIIILDKTPITISRYAIDGLGELEPMTPDELLEGEAIMKEMKPVINRLPSELSTITMDVASLKDRSQGHLVVELGCLNTCDWYNCDLNKIVKALSPK